MSNLLKKIFVRLLGFEKNDMNESLFSVLSDITSVQNSVIEGKVHENKQEHYLSSEALVNNGKEIKEKNSAGEVYNLVILDESGSMSDIRNEIIEVLKFIYKNLNQISSQKTNLVSYFSFLSFCDQKIKYHEWNLPVRNKMKMNYNYLPNGSTNLLDACCQALLRMEKDLSNKDNFNVLVTIITDGEENSSCTFTPEQTSELIERLKRTGKWHFMYVGADHDVEKASQKLRINDFMIFKKTSDGLNGMKVNLVYSISNFYDKLHVNDLKRGNHLKIKK